MMIDKPYLFGDQGLASGAGISATRSIPAKADVLNIQVITTSANAWHTFSPNAVATKRSQQQTLTYKFVRESCEPCQVFTPLEMSRLGKELVDINEIYDIDVEHEMFVHKKDSNVIFTPDLDTPTSTNPEKYFALPSGILTSYKTGSIALDPTDDIWVGGGVDADGIDQRAFALVILGANKQKLLGDWLEKYSTNGTLHTMTPWLFDRLCYELKPMFAKHFLPTFENEAPVNTMYFKPAAGGGAGAFNEVRVAESGEYNRIIWQNREFHRYQDAVVATAAETLTNQLLISCVGYKASFQDFSALRLRVFHNREKRSRQELYFLDKGLQYYMTNGDKGERKEYGVEDWGQGGTTIAVPGDLNFAGIITCQEGELDWFKEGKLNDKTADDNLLQSVDEVTDGTWYYNQPDLWNLSTLG